MGNFISKFNLYEYFRILLPGAYLTFLIYVVYKCFLTKNLGHYHWSVIILLLVISSLILGALIYSWDFPRFLKKYTLIIFPQD